MARTGQFAECHSGGCCGHADLAITSRYLRGIDNTEIIEAVHQRPEPMIPASRHLLASR
jgi:hypothetical protein